MSDIIGLNSKQKKILRDLEVEMPLVISYEKIKARIVREKYNAYLANGFDEKQALYLCKTEDKPGE